MLGELDGSPILASETCALDIIGAKFIRDVENGEVVVISKDGVESLRPFPQSRDAPLHLRIYLFRPTRFGRARPLGLRGAQEHGRANSRARRRPTPTSSFRCPIPASPRRSATRRASGLPFELGIVRNHYVGRTFIQPTQAVRELGVRLKHNANRAVIDGRRIVLIDDSIVRGTTSVKIVQMMREAGAREVHLRISSPPIAYPDFYGIDTPDRDKLLAARMNLEQMRAFMGADSLAFLSIDGTYRAMGYASRDARNPQFTDHCFTGDYPTRLVDQTAERGFQQLSLLAEAS